MNVQRDEHQPHWKSRGGLWARSQRSTRTLYTGHGDRALPRSAGSRPVTVAAVAMLTPRTASLLTLLLAVGSLGQRAQRPPRPPSPISTIQPKANFDTQQFSGTWFLVAVASSCRSLQEQGHRAEATTLHVTPQGAAMAVSTFRKLDGICWQVRQLYGDTGLPGRFLLQARGARGAVDVVVGETDYRGFAIVYLERARQLSVKLYGTSPRDRVCTPAGPSGWARWAHGPSPPFPLPLPLGPDVGTERRPVGGGQGSDRSPRHTAQLPERPARPARTHPAGAQEPCVSRTQPARSP
ncbi:complement component C8 gamma chain isoform X1 [Balaenoptera ricei]|uniref:complement component C8 gamma chain isoform X1 n=1 Tax=Balaenoptera ricei TaxID=2746895 RepID=UPI0028BDAD93|nr:complement component C8 gamma chain isoform X1 [Balaenoptera ricei]